MTITADNFRPADQTLGRLWAAISVYESEKSGWWRPQTDAGRVAALEVGQATIIECASPARVLAIVSEWKGAEYRAEPKDTRRWIVERVK